MIEQNWHVIYDHMGSAFDNFVKTLGHLVDHYKFGGIDLDVEQRSVLNMASAEGFYSVWGGPAREVPGIYNLTYRPGQHRRARLLA